MARDRAQSKPDSCMEFSGWQKYADQRCTGAAREVTHPDRTFRHGVEPTPSPG
jgi:hypothetical protein